METKSLEGWRILAVIPVLLFMGCFMPRISFSAETPKDTGDVFSLPQTMKMTLQIEAALARAQAKLGIIPQWASDEINRKADIKYSPQKAVEEEKKRVGHHLVATLNVWIKSMEGGAGEYVYYGATTQDIFDTLSVLQLRSAARIMLNDLRDIEASLLDLAQRHRDTPMVGRTLGQHALPITFGLKVGVWIGENRRNMERLKDCMKRLNTGMLSGAVGSYAGLGEKGFELEDLFMKELGLGKPEPVDWHGARDGFAEFGNVMSLVGMSFAKIGQEIFLLQSTQIGEVEEYASGRRVGSSTMPQKRNPAASRILVQQARKVRRSAEILLDWMVSIHERDQITSEDELGPLCEDMDTLLKAAKPLLKELVVKPDAMRRNLDLTKGLIMSERMMFVLGEKIGKHNAHEVVRQRAMEAFNKNITFKEALLSDPEVAKHLKREELDDLLDPTKYTGLSGQVADRVVEWAKKLRATDSL